MHYFFYILRCADNSLYSGVTTDLNRRLLEHNGEGNNGAKYTRSHRPVQLVHVEQYEGRSAALRRESEVKNMTKKEKEKLLE